MTAHHSAFQPAPMPTGLVRHGDQSYMHNATGDLTAVENIPALKKLRDEMVRREFGYAIALSEQITRFRAHTMANLGAFDALMAQEYNVTVGGEKGNRTYTSFDGLWKIEVRVQDRLAFDAGMQIAKALFDECLREWAEGTRAEMRSIVTNAFDTDKEGQINRTNIFILLGTESDDSRWQEGQRAIREAMYVIGSKEYLRFSFRDSCRDRWKALTIDLASA